MRNRTRRNVFAAALLALSLAQPAFASSRMEMGDEPSAVPMIFDALFMRPIGLLMTAVGTVVYIVPVAPIMLVTRPTVGAGDAALAAQATRSAGEVGASTVRVGGSGFRLSTTVPQKHRTSTRKGRVPSWAATMRRGPSSTRVRQVGQ